MVFNYESMEIIIKDKVNDMNIITIKHREHRKDNSMFFSRIVEYNQLGFIFNNSFHLLKKYMKCINCQFEFSNNKNCFFLNSRNIMPTRKYNYLKNKYNLNTINEYYYDQRRAMNKFLKMEIYEKALHPDRIEKILDMTCDHWSNLDIYI